MTAFPLRMDSNVSVECSCHFVIPRLETGVFAMYNDSKQQAWSKQAGKSHSGFSESIMLPFIYAIRIAILTGTIHVQTLFEIAAYSISLAKPFKLYHVVQVQVTSPSKDRPIWYSIKKGDGIWIRKRSIHWKSDGLLCYEWKFTLMSIKFPAITLLVSPSTCSPSFLLYITSLDWLWKLRFLNPYGKVMCREKIKTRAVSIPNPKLALGSVSFEKLRWNLTQ